MKRYTLENADTNDQFLYEDDEGDYILMEYAKYKALKDVWDEINNALDVDKLIQLYNVTRNDNNKNTN